MLSFVEITTCGTPKVTRATLGGNSVGGVTSLGDDVFVVRFNRGFKSQQIEVYDAMSLTLQRCLSVPDSGSRSHGLAVCANNNCLYASDWFQHSVHRVELSGSSNAVTQWSVASQPHGLTVNNANNLLVASYGEHKLQEFTTHGTLLQNIQLQLEPCHAVPLANGQFVVSSRKPLPCVRLVDANGAVIQSYGGQKGSQLSEIKEPKGLAVDKHGNILVAEERNNRLLVLDPSLTIAHEMSVSVDGGLNGPVSLWYDKSRGRLYIGEWEGGRVIVIDDLKDFSTSKV